MISTSEASERFKMYTFVMHYPFRNIYLYARASAQNHRVFSHMSQGMYAFSINNYSSGNIDVLQVDVTAKISHCGALSNELFCFYHDFNNCFYRGLITENRICHT